MEKDKEINCQDKETHLLEFVDNDDESDSFKSDEDKINSIKKNSILDTKYNITKQEKRKIDQSNIVLNKIDQGRFALFETSKLLIQENTLLGISSAAVYLTHIFNIILLNNYSGNDLLYTSSYQIGCIFLSVLGFNFLNGTLDSFRGISSYSIIKKDYERFLRFYQEARIFSILIFVLIIFPLSFTSGYFLKIFNLNEDLIRVTGLFIKLTMPAYFLLIISDINTIFISYVQHNSYILVINTTTLVIHIIFSLLFVYKFEFGSIGISISMIFSSFCKFILTQFFCFYFNPTNKSVIKLDVAVLTSNFIFFYIKNASILGFITYIKNLPFDLFLFSGFFFGYKTFLTNIIILNIIYFNYNLIIKSITCNYETILNPHIMKTIKNIEEFDLKEFLSTQPKLKKYFDNKKKDYVTQIKSICLNTQLTRHIAAIDNLFQIFNKNKIDNLINSMINFSYVLMVLNCILLYFTKGFLIQMFTQDEKISCQCNTLLSIYCVVLIFDWIEVIYSSLLACFSSWFNYIIVRGLFGVFVFFPMGMVSSDVYNNGVYGYFYSFYVYFFVFAIVAFFYYKSIDLNKASHKMREIYMLTQIKNENFENLYKVTHK